MHHTGKEYECFNNTLQDTIKTIVHKEKEGLYTHYRRKKLIL